MEQKRNARRRHTCSITFCFVVSLKSSSYSLFGNELKINQIERWSVSMVIVR